MAAIRIGDMFARVLKELDQARYCLADAASWARSDWSDNRPLTDAEAQARSAVFEAVQLGKDAIDHAKHLICRTWEQ